jgi:glycosyltransferase involved in cell wall biosynthesis
MPEPIRLLELRSTYKWGGGPDKTILNSALLHDPDLLNVTVAYLRGADDDEFTLGDRGRAMGLDIVEISEERRFDWRAFRELVATIDRKRIDIVHGRDYKSNVYALLIKRLFNRRLKIVTTAHGWVGSGLKLRAYYALDRIIKSRFDRNFILFRDQVDEFLVKPDPATTIVIHNAIDPEDWSPDAVEPGRFRGELDALHVPSDATLIGTVGRIMPEKDILTMVEVAEELVKRRGRKAVFVLVGEGKTKDYERRVQQAVRRAGLTDVFLLVGPRSDPKPVYRDLDIFLLTSIKEGFPNSVLEAMAMRVPAVVSAVDGIPEILEHEKSAMLCRPGAVSRFADSLEAVMDDTALRERLQDEARTLTETSLSFSYRLKRMEEEYARLMAEG